MDDSRQVIPAKFRAALLAKGLLLASMAALFVGLGVAAWARSGWPVPVRVSVIIIAGVLALFLSWAAALALLDAVLGWAVRATGAVPLRSRRAGHSLKLPDGRHVEYILHNPWEPLRQGETYSVLYGRHSRVLVAPPERVVSPRVPGQGAATR